MNFQPVIPFGGMAGWAFLQRTQESQQAAFAASPVVQRDTEYFAENIGKIDTAEELVSDFRLLKVALGAFGLDDDIGNKFFIQKILEDGSIDPDALANKMSDKRYLEFTKAFGFGDFSTPNTKLSDFANTTLEAYRTRQFEVAVGDRDSDLRLSLGLERDLGTVVDLTTTDDGRWFTIMGNPPLRKIFETALGLPASFGTLDLDLQLTGFRDKAKAVFGNGEISQFEDPEKLEELNRLFLVRAQLNTGSAGMSSGAIALTLLQNI
ncbi:MAG TPA: DUF1217 domain-containing protein [Aliiroseovarius sp.]|nr:DUF1217 domain-containing protein [Aliiroseovarius sp.]